MIPHTFRHELDSRIAKHDLLCHPFYQAWSQGALTREDLRAYAADYYHHVAAFPEYLRAFEEQLQERAHSETVDSSLVEAVAQNRADEEGGDGPNSRSHAELWLDFAAGMGNDRETVLHREPCAELKELMATFHKIASEGTSAQALAAFYAYESQVPRIAKEKELGLVQKYGADRATCAYFTLHQTADVFHSKTWQEQLERAASTPESQQQALDTATQVAAALWRALDGIERERLARPA